MQNITTQEDHIHRDQNDKVREEKNTLKTTTKNSYMHTPTTKQKAGSGSGWGGGGGGTKYTSNILKVKYYRQVICTTRTIAMRAIQTSSGCGPDGKLHEQSQQVGHFPSEHSLALAPC